MKRLNKERLTLILVISVVFLIKAAIILFFLKSIRCFEVNEIAINICRTGEMKYFFNGQINYNYQFPVYPILIYLIYAAFGIHYKLVLLFNLILNSLTAYFLYFVFKEFISFFRNSEAIGKWSKSIVFISTVGFLVHPLITYYAIAVIHSFTLDCFFSIVLLLQMFRFGKLPGKGNLVIYSFLFGLAVLSRTTTIVLIIPFIILSSSKFRKIDTIKYLSIILFVAFAILSTWIIRNYIRDKSLMINSGLGQDLWIGVQEQTEGTTQMPYGKNYYNLLSKDELMRIPEMNAARQNEFFMHKYWIIIKNDPLHIVKMFCIKIKNFWYFRTGLGSDYEKYIKNYIIIYKSSYLLCLVFTIISILMLKSQILFLLSYPICLSVMQSLVYVETRHRIIIEPFLIFTAVIGIFYLITTFTKKELFTK